MQVLNLVSEITQLYLREEHTPRAYRFQPATSNFKKLVNESMPRLQKIEQQDTGKTTSEMNV